MEIISITHSPLTLRYRSDSALKRCFAHSISFPRHHIPSCCVCVSLFSFLFILFLSLFFICFFYLCTRWWLNVIDVEPKVYRVVVLFNWVKCAKKPRGKWESTTYSTVKNKERCRVRRGRENMTGASNLRLVNKIAPVAPFVRRIIRLIGKSSSHKKKKRRNCGQHSNPRAASC